MPNLNETECSCQGIYDATNSMCVPSTPEEPTVPEVPEAPIMDLPIIENQEDLNQKDETVLETVEETAPNAATRPEIEHVVEPVVESADYKFYEPGQAPEYVADYGKNISEKCQSVFFP